MTRTSSRPAAQGLPVAAQPGASPPGFLYRRSGRRIMAGQWHRMRTAIVIAVCVAAVAGCAAAARPARVPPAPAPQPPFDDAPVSFVVAGPRFTPGEVTIVKVCIAADHRVLSADIMASSGDRRFDDFALSWARQVRIRAAPADGAALQPCGEVRVEIRKPSEPRVISGADSALS
jgi:hypothetical protein